MNLRITHCQNLISVENEALVDSGAEGIFVDEQIVQQTRKLMTPLRVRNVDGTDNEGGHITKEARIRFRLGNREFDKWCYVTKLGDLSIILGMPWLKRHNPLINWKKGTFETFDWTKDQERYETIMTMIRFIGGNMTPQTKQTSETEAYLYLLDADFLPETEVWVRAKSSVATQLAQEEAEHRAKVVLPEEYRKYEQVFKERESGKMPQRREWDHEIVLKPRFKPKRMAPYPMDQKMEALTLRWLDEMKRKGFIRASDSAMTSPLFWVEKKVKEEYRPCQDYRHVNSGRVPNAYPLPTISDLILRLQGQKYFTKFDVRWGYNNVRIKEGDEWKAAFSTPFGSYEPTVMFFGLCNSPATFQKMMNEYFFDFIKEGWICIYMDDILIAAFTLQELRERTRRVLQRLLDCDLYLKLDKCQFEKKEIEFLGMIISWNQIRMDTSKLLGIKKWTPPTTVKQVRSFLGFCNFYRKFIGHYAEISKPLTELTKKDEQFVWTKA